MHTLLVVYLTMIFVLVLVSEAVIIRIRMHLTALERVSMWLTFILWPLFLINLVRSAKTDME